MANAQVILQLSLNFFTRNNPITSIIEGVTQSVESLINMPSQMKLMKFRFMLYKQQLESIENNLTEGERAAKGSKVDRRF
jgi:hypothetical protein